MIRVDGLGAHAGDFALQDVSFELQQGAWGIVLGPAGAGKTTLLETIAGVRPVDAGSVTLRNVDVTRTPAEQRGVGIVYQHAFLFPHLSVEANVAYGTRDRAYALEVARRLGVGTLMKRAVGNLSGGERQMVAIARALAPEPDILLLDEPFAAVDPRNRTRLRRELRSMQWEQSLTVLHVTHDFGEAGTLGDLAILLEGGRLLQAARPETLFRRPPSAAAAEFLGAENVFAGMTMPIESPTADELGVMLFRSGTLTLVGVADSRTATHAVIRGEDVVLSVGPTAPSSARNALEGVVAEVVIHGALARVTVDIGEFPLVATVTAGSVSTLRLLPGSRVVATIKATAVHLC
ncbi:MAG TPA: ATP-binding cassette domain-containing protein [Gemmatimonadaceae bacterium]